MINKTKQARNAILLLLWFTPALAQPGLSNPMSISWPNPTTHLPEKALALRTISSVAKDDPPFLDAAKVLYAKADYMGLAQLAKSYLASYPDDSNAHYLLGVAYLRIGKRDEAQAEAERLAKGQDNVGKMLADKLTTMLKRSDSLEKAKAALQEQMGRYDVEGASHVIQQMDVPQSQKQILQIYLSVYHGRFELARYQLDKLYTLHPQLEKEWIEVRDFIERSAAEYQAYLGRLIWLRQAWDTMWQPPESSLFYRPAGLKEDYQPHYGIIKRGGQQIKAESDKFTQETFRYTFDAVSHIVNVAPLNEASLEWLFQVALFTRTYEAIERLGDKILAGQGSLIVPMTEKLTNYQMIIDKKRGRLILVDDDSSIFRGRNKGSSFWMESAETFNVGFDQIEDLRQSANYKTSVLDESNCNQARMFESKSGHARFTATPFLFLFGNLYGELASRRVILNFGKFMVHVINRPQIKAELIKQEVGGGLNFATILMAAGAVASSAQGNTQQAAVLLDSLNRLDQENQAAKLQQQQQFRSWEKLAADASFDLPIKIMFREFDTVLKELR